MVDKIILAQIKAGAWLCPICDWWVEIKLPPQEFTILLSIIEHLSQHILDNTKVSETDN